MGGCESGFTVPDLTDPNMVWATCYGNKVTRWDARYHAGRSVSPWMITLDSPPNDIKYRCHWTLPLAIDPFDHNTVYYGCQVIFKTTNRRPKLVGDQSRPVDARSVPHRSVRRNRRRQSRPILWRGRLRHRSLENQKGTHLGGDQRRASLVHQRRRELDQCHEKYFWTPPLGHGHQHCALCLRCGHGLRQRRLPSRWTTAILSSTRPRTWARPGS